MVDDDIGTIIYVVVIVLIYGVLFMGAFSPIHCRMVLTILGLVAVFGSVYAGFGLSYMLGYKKE